MPPTNINTHYLDYYSNWKKSFHNASGFYELMLCDKLGMRFMGILRERIDAGLMTHEHATAYATELNEATNSKLKAFLN